MRNKILLDSIHFAKNNFINILSSRHLQSYIKKHGGKANYIFCDDLVATTKCSFTNDVLRSVFLDQKFDIKKIKYWDKSFIEAIIRNKNALEQSKNQFYVYTLHLQFGNYNDKASDGHVVTILQYLDTDCQEVRYTFLQSYAQCYSLMNYLRSESLNEIQIDYSNEEFTTFLLWLDNLHKATEWTEEIEHNYFKYFFVSKNLVGCKFGQGFYISAEYVENTYDNLIHLKQNLQENINSTKAFLIQYNYKAEHKKYIDQHFQYDQDSLKNPEKLVCGVLTDAQVLTPYIISLEKIKTFIELIASKKSKLNLPWHERTLNRPYEPVSFDLTRKKPNVKNSEIKESKIVTPSSNYPIKLFNTPKDLLEGVRNTAEGAYNRFQGAMIFLPEKDIDSLNPDVFVKLDEWFQEIKAYIQACNTQNVKEILYTHIVGSFKKWNISLETETIRIRNNSNIEYKI